jgi:Thiopurine S-methyltransferase (TPMT)
LIPGCGTDHGVIKAFADAGFDVTAIDFSTVAVGQVKRALGIPMTKLSVEIFSSSTSNAALI